MSKRLFIGVGSTAVFGLIALIRRCMQENIYHDSADAFVGIDSDDRKTKLLEDLDSSNRHIRGIQLKLPPDDPGRGLAIQFQPGFSNLSIPPIGVGGDRRSSFVARDWISDAFLGARIQGLVPGDEVVLIGSAFGGTSTGQFFNIAQWIRKQLAAQAGDGHGGAIPFYAAIVLPETPQAGDRYPLARNLCSFMKDLQSATWIEQLSERGAGQRLRVPSFILSPPGKDLPLLTPERHGRSDVSFLPFDWAFVFPTPTGGQSYVPDAVAEAVFQLSYLRLYSDALMSKTIDLATGSGGRTMTDRAHFGFGGMNFVSARNGKNTLLKRRAYELLEQRWKAFVENQSSRDAEDYRWAKAVLESCLQRNEETNARILALAQQVRDQFGVEPETMQNRLPGQLDDLRRQLTNYPYEWPSFEEYLGELARTFDAEKAVAPVARALSSMAEGLKILTLEAICTAYTDKMGEIEGSAARKSHGRTAHETSGYDDRKRDLLNAVNRARAMLSRRRDSRVAAVLGVRGTAEAEVRDELRTALGVLLERLIHACRSLETLPRLTPPVTKKEELEGERREHYRRVGEQLNSVLRSPGQGLPPFVCESPGNEPLGGLSLAARGSLFHETILSCIRARSQPESETCIERYEHQAIHLLHSDAERLGPANPLTRLKTRMNPESVKSYCNLFALADTRQFHFTYYLQHGDASDITYEQLMEGLGFRSFGNMGGYNRAGVFSPVANLRPEDPRSFHQMVVNPSRTVGGLWIGTVALDLELGDAVKKAYQNQDPGSLQSRIAQDELQYGADKPRLMTLKQSVLLGAVLGAMEGALQGRVAPESLAARRIVLRVRSGTAGDPVLADTVVAQDVCDLDLQGRVILARIPVKWVPGLLSWINGSFEKDLGVSGADQIGGALEVENLILTHMQLKIDAAKLRMIDELIRKLAAHIEVSDVA